MNFESEMEKRTEEAQNIVLSYLPEPEGFQKTLLSAMDYSMRSGGKRLRPMLMRLAFEMFGANGPDPAPFMAAIEMIHTHSLIHDDLPAMDNDEYRRGRKTTHIVYGEAMAILAGDGLLNLAYETAARSMTASSYPDRCAKAMQVLAVKTGFSGMIGGQSTDVELEGTVISEDTLDFIYRLKTAALLEASLMIGAVLAGADEESISDMELIGRNIGLAFQIRDDILDVTGTQEEIGKPVGSDAKNNKTTYVTYVGIDGADREAKRLTGEAVSLLDACKRRGHESEFLRSLLLSLAERRS
ncbi:MAG: polyprenyl synthetase family protein [Lachnospiraceae bacterium]|nr:polyprenyl synthetase family protein [Lachnospiraceae bacterium]